jgi:hypothetical protein
MILKILIAVVVIVLLLVVVVATRRSSFHVERSATIAAPPERLFERVNDLHAWRSWSPWEKKDPDMSRTYGGPPTGVGATYGWAGDKNVGEGRMTIERSDRPSLVEIKLEFFKPFKGTNTARFTFEPAAGGTKVIWGMDGKYNFVSKAFCMFMDMDKMIGTDFEAGLAALKAEAESGKGAVTAARATAAAGATARVAD